MIRFLFRIVSLILFCTALILAIGDLASSIAASKLILKPFGESLQAVMPTMFETAEETITTKFGLTVWQLVQLALGLPGFVVAGILAFIFYASGYRPSSRFEGLGTHR